MCTNGCRGSRISISSYKPLASRLETKTHSRSTPSSCTSKAAALELGKSLLPSAALKVLLFDVLVSSRTLGLAGHDHGNGHRRRRRTGGLGSERHGRRVKTCVGRDATQGWSVSSRLAVVAGKAREGALRAGRSFLRRRVRS